jgi:hypothetical protein
VRVTSTRTARWPARALATLLALGAGSAPLAAYESDQYTNRGVAIADAQPVLDREVDRALAEIAAGWRGAEDRRRFARRVYWRLGGLYWVDHLERWAIASPEVERLPQYRQRSIFANAPLYASRVNWFFGVGATFRLAGSLVGSDKLGHFFSQGIKYYGSHLLGREEQRVLGRGRFNERWLFGQLTTSVYSNADLVANFEGYRFYRSLFEAEVVPGKGPLVAFRDGGAEILRPFAWSDHVNDFWDEAAYPSHLSPGLERYLMRTLPGLCPEFERDPFVYLPRDEAELAARYRKLGLKPAPELRMDHVCADAAGAAGG